MARNAGMALDLDWVMRSQANRSAIERRVATLAGRRTVNKEYQAAWLCRAISCIDLTTLAGDDTVGRVHRLAAKARQPVRADLLDSLGMEGLRVGTVCVYHEMIAPARAALEGSGIPVAAVSTGFPAGLTPFHLRLAEIEESVKAGAEEIDIVISLRHVLTGNWAAHYDEISAFRAACGPAHLKAILATGELGTLRNVARASLVAMMAGADFIKTSTGKEAANATLPVSLVMIRAIRDYYAATGHRVGYKPAGGIGKAKDALSYLVLIKEELGKPWLTPALFRFGHFIDGAFTPPGDGFLSRNPANGETLETLTQATQVDVDAAVAAARKAQGKWARLGGHGRAKHLYAIARILQRNARLCAVLETLDNGKPILESRDIDLPLAQRHFYFHAGMAQLMESQLPDRAPVGVCGQVI